jgi:hypothetical protein
MKSFSNKSSLTRHFTRFKVCDDWCNNRNNTTEIPDVSKITKGIHLIVSELLEQAVGELECKFCKTKFITKGNQHKHFNTATVCNRLAFDEFKKIINNM